MFSSKVGNHNSKHVTQVLEFGNETTYNSEVAKSYTDTK
uniref:Uncharacterized protein n=1 Tax=Arundo donax TaxID=35708 RepID=A0A0A8ZT85_ARUDO